MTQEIHPPAKRRRRITWRRALAVLVVLALVGEISLRVFFGFGHPLLYQVDAPCGYLPKPSQDLVRLRSHNFINAHSMRSPEFTTPRPADRFRILCIGDSVTYGTTYVPQDQIFTSQLATSLTQFLRKSVEVLNESTGGWAPENEVKVLLSRGTYDANIVLMVWNTGDLDQPFATFPGGLSFPTEDPWTATDEVWSRYVAPRLFHGTPTVDPGAIAAVDSAEGIQIAAKNLDLLTQAQAYATRSGADFGMVFVPSGPAFQSSGRAQMHSRLVTWSQEHHVFLLDLTDVFSRETWEELTLDGIHLRPHGHDVVAREITARWSEFQAALATSPATRVSLPAVH